MKLSILLASLLTGFALASSAGFNNVQENAAHLQARNAEPEAVANPLLKEWATYPVRKYENMVKNPVNYSLKKMSNKVIDKLTGKGSSKKNKKKDKKKKGKAAFRFKA